MHHSFRMCIGVALLLVMSMMAPRAHADQLYKLVRVTCVPEAGYGSVETFTVYNLEDIAALARKDILLLGALQDHPITCGLRKGALVVELSRYYPPRATGMCGAVEDGELKVSLNGTELTEVSSTHGGCTPFEPFQHHEICISTDELQHCVTMLEDVTVRATDFTTMPTRCKRVPLP